MSEKESFRGSDVLEHRSPRGIRNVSVPRSLPFRHVARSGHEKRQPLLRLLGCGRRFAAARRFLFRRRFPVALFQNYHGAHKFFLPMVIKPNRNSFFVTSKNRAEAITLVLHLLAGCKSTHIKIIAFSPLARFHASRLVPLPPRPSLYRSAPSHTCRFLGRSPLQAALVTQQQTDPQSDSPVPASAPTSSLCRRFPRLSRQGSSPPWLRFWRFRNRRP